MRIIRALQLSYPVPQPSLTTGQDASLAYTSMGAARAHGVKQVDLVPNLIGQPRSECAATCGAAW